MVSIEQVSDQLAPQWLRDFAKYWKWIALALLLLILLLIVLAAAFVGVVAAAVVMVVVAVAAVALRPVIRKLLQRARAADELKLSGFTPAAAAQAPPNASFWWRFAAHCAEILHQNATRGRGGLRPTAVASRAWISETPHRISSWPPTTGAP